MDNAKNSAYKPSDTVLADSVLVNFSGFFTMVDGKGIYHMLKKYFKSLLYQRNMFLKMYLPKYVDWICNKTEGAQLVGKGS